ncbi:hypothetical protein [uncultured Alistipes sp.]|uniref:hypothetical protein n=1 Tax=uncultured Alistipes sp. TaxID=538949 RepID=UPI00272A992E|nr:hypothetical protein [uncultured Alistipes sp.]
MEHPIYSALSEITQELGDMRPGDKRAHTDIAFCVRRLLSWDARTDDERRNVLQACLPVLDQLAAMLPDGDTETPFYRSIAMLIRGDYQGYLAETERFCAAERAEDIRLNGEPTENPGFYDAYRYFILIGLKLPVLWDRDDQFKEDVLRAYQELAIRYFPESAFGLECEFMLSKGPDEEKIRLLRAILEKDRTWTSAWLMLGGPHYEEPAWSQPLDDFRKALAGDVARYGDILFRAACAAEVLDDHDAAFGYYRDCAEYMLNNTEFYRQKAMLLT